MNFCLQYATLLLPEKNSNVYYEEEEKWKIQCFVAKIFTILFISVQYPVFGVATNNFIQKRILDCEKEKDSTLELFSVKQKKMHKNEMTAKLKFQKLSEINEILLYHNHLRFIRS